MTAADTLVLCDTDGGTLPDDAARIVAEIVARSATVGVSDDVVTASWEALADGVVYGLLRAGAAVAGVDAPSRPEIPEAV